MGDCRSAVRLAEGCWGGDRCSWAEGAEADGRGGRRGREAQGEGGTVGAGGEGARLEAKAKGGRLKTEDAGRSRPERPTPRPPPCSELRDELPGQRWNEGLQAIISGRGPVIHARRGVRAIERAHFDGITRLAPFEVVAEVFLAADRRRLDVSRESCSHCPWRAEGRRTSRPARRSPLRPTDKCHRSCRSSPCTRWARIRIGRLTGKIVVGRCHGDHRRAASSDA